MKTEYNWVITWLWPIVIPIAICFVLIFNLALAWNNIGIKLANSVDTLDDFCERTISKIK